MTILEIAIFIGVALLLYKIMNPLQKKLERELFKFFRTKTNNRGETIIDVTDSIKKDKSDEKH